MTRVLFLGCHCDDIELGCGGTISRFRHEWDIHCHILSHSGIGDETADLKGICRRSMKKLGVKKLSFSPFKPSLFHQDRQKVWEVLREINDNNPPDIVFVHEDDDHQDHQVAWLESNRAFGRRCGLIQYQIARSSQHFHANLFVALQRKHLKSKQNALSEYREVYDKNYLKKRSIRAQALSAGLYVEKKYCESFMIKRLFDLGI